VEADYSGLELGDLAGPTLKTNAHLFKYDTNYVGAVDNQEPKG